MGSLRSWIGSILSLVVFFLVRRLTIGIAAPSLVATIFACVYVWLLVLRVPELKNIEPAQPEEVIQPPSKSSQEARPSATDTPQAPSSKPPEVEATRDAPINQEQREISSVPDTPPCVAVSGEDANKCTENVPQVQSSCSSPPQEVTTENICSATSNDLPSTIRNEKNVADTQEDNVVSSSPSANEPVTEGAVSSSKGLDSETSEQIGKESRESEVGQTNDNTSSLHRDDSDDDSEEDDELVNQEDDEDVHADPEKAQELRLEGNEYFKANKLHDAREAYSEALYLTPVADKKSRAVLHANRAACLQKLSRWDDVVDDCKHAVDLDPTYAKAYHRRSAAYEALEKWHDANEDLKKAMELDPALKSKEYKRQTVLEHKAQVQFEKDKDEMMDKLKGFGNMVLGKFGMSTENFKCEKDPDSGSYSIKFQQ